MMFTMILAVGALLAAHASMPLATDPSRAEDKQGAFEHALAGPDVLRAPLSVRAFEQVEQLTNPRTGVTCTMQILRARPADPQSVSPSVPSVDPDIRGHVSPCLE